MTPRARRTAPAPRAFPVRPPPTRAALPGVSRSLSIHLLRSREAVMRFFRPHLRRLGLTEQQWRVLRVLNDSGPMDAGRLASDAVLLPPSLSRIVRDLMRRGCLARRALRDDRRRVELSITAAGVDLLRRGARDSLRAYGRIAELFGSAQLDQLMTLLDRLERRLAQGEGSGQTSATAGQDT
jgi:homoprotocatechuate degradation regulator HpaR